MLADGAFMDLLPLRLFNEKVDRLDRCRLAKRMENPQYQLQYDKMIIVTGSRQTALPKMT